MGFLLVSDIAIDGEMRLAESAALGLVDQCLARVHPVLVGGGIPFFCQRECRVDLELVETRTFSSKVEYLRRCIAREQFRAPLMMFRPMRLSVLQVRNLDGAPLLRIVADSI